jgi:3-oxoacyl-(acyl-carrier-protein) synthase
LKALPISITGMASVSPLGADLSAVWQAYLKEQSYLKVKQFDLFDAWVGALSQADDAEIERLRNSDPNYRKLDRSVLLALYTSRKAFSQVAWNRDFGVNIGSSRGATSLFEKFHDAFLKHPFGKTETRTSPTTTLGNIASWVAHDLQTKGPAISHSITCSTALHALLNGVAWMRSGMVKCFLVGGSEAANTPFTIAQMKALKIDASSVSDPYPCKVVGFDKKRKYHGFGRGSRFLLFGAGHFKKGFGIDPRCGVRHGNFNPQHINF